MNCTCKIKPEGLDIEGCKLHENEIYKLRREIENLKADLLEVLNLLHGGATAWRDVKASILDGLTYDYIDCLACKKEILKITKKGSK